MDPTQNDGFGGQQPMNMGYSGVPISSGTDDIVLNNGGGGKPKKRLIIGVIVGVIVIVGVVVGVLMMNGVFGRNSFTAREKFNRLMNYAINGEDSVTSIDEGYNNNEDYYFDKMQNTLDDRKIVFDRASELMNDFMDSWNERDKEVDSDSDLGQLQTIMKNEKEILDFSKVVRIKRIPSVYDIAGVFQSEGEEGTKNYYANYYDYSTFDNVLMNEFEEAFTKYYNAQIEVVKMYYENKCLSGNTIRSNCIEDTGDVILAEAYNNRISVVEGAKVEVYRYYNLSDDLVINLFRALTFVSDGGSRVISVKELLNA